MRPSKFIERGKIDTLTQIHDLSLSWFTRYYSSSSYVIEIRVVCSIVSFLVTRMLEDTKRLIGRKTHNTMVKEKKVKMINNDLQNTTQKTKIQHQVPH
jgi:hypothetical protein